MFRPAIAMQDLSQVLERDQVPISFGTCSVSGRATKRWRINFPVCGRGAVSEPVKRVVAFARVCLRISAPISLNRSHSSEAWSASRRVSNAAIRRSCAEINPRSVSLNFRDHCNSAHSYSTSLGSRGHPGHEPPVCPFRLELPFRTRLANSASARCRFGPASIASRLTSFSGNFSIFVFSCESRTQESRSLLSATRRYFHP